MLNQKPIYFCLDDRVITYQIDLNTKLVYQLGDDDKEETKKLAPHITYKILEKGEVSDDEDENTTKIRYIVFSAFDVKIYIH
jgi:hypothetical protein